jgi:hypothetical protein
MADLQSVDSGKDFESASKEARRSFLGEYVDFLRATAKYWLIAILLIFLGLGLLVALGGTAAAPFIYTLF